MTSTGHAGSAGNKPVLLVYGSAGFPFGLTPDNSLVLHEITAASEHPDADGDLVVFASPDAAVAWSCQPLHTMDATWQRAVVLIDDWTGHDHALRNFTLMFVMYRLKECGFSAVRFLVPGDGVPAGGWREELDVVQRALPTPPPTPASASMTGRAGLGLLLDPSSDNTGIIDWAHRIQSERDVRVIAIPSDPEAVPGDLPATFHGPVDGGERWPWLAARMDVLTYHGHPYAHRRYLDLARRSGMPVVDVTGLSGREMANRLLGNGDPAAKRSRDTGQYLADWFREMMNEPGAGA